MRFKPIAVAPAASEFADPPLNAVSVQDGVAREAPCDQARVQDAGKAEVLFDDATTPDGT